jgi:di/tricarboxylate transporter
VALWIFGGSIGVNAVAAAIVGLTILLVTGVTSWKVRMHSGDWRFTVLCWWSYLGSGLAPEQQNL